MTDTPDPLPPSSERGGPTAPTGRAADPGVASRAAGPAAAGTPAAGDPMPSGTATRAPLAWLLAGAAIALASVAAALAWQSQGRLQRLEAELVRRQQAGSESIAEAVTLARQSHEQSREALAKTTLLELRVAEIGAARQQVDELLQSITRSGDEAVLAELEAGLRMAMHQTAISGSADALLLSLRHAEERLAAVTSPLLVRVRRAVAADLERARASAAPDPAMLAGRLEEALRSVETLPLLAEPDVAAAPTSAPKASGPRRDEARRPPAAAAGTSAPTGVAAGEGQPSDAAPLPAWHRGAQALWEGVRDETLGLVRLRRIDAPEAALLAPEQADYLRRHLELRLLGARVAVLARRHEAAQADLAAARALLDRYFDRRARPVQAVAETLRQVVAQARPAALPRPEATLAAIATASGR